VSSLYFSQIKHVHTTVSLAYTNGIKMQTQCRSLSGADV